MKAKKTVLNRTYYKWTFATFNVSSSLQEFSVPAGTKKLIVDCVASKGLDDTSPGGKGGRVQCTLPVTPSSTLYFYVGAIPSTKQTPEYNASDIRTDNTGVLDSTSLSSRLVVAGGGACGGITASNSGGDGGGLTGGAGGTGVNTFGQGGTQTAGGAGARSVGSDGTFGIGGTGSSSNTNNTSGGAGWYGGGGGRAGYTGGGGSSYTDPSCKAITHTQGYNDGSGYVKITYAVVSTPDDYDFYEEEAKYSLVNKPIGSQDVFYGVRGLSKGEVYNSVTPVGYTLQGNPTIDGTEAKNFSLNDYMKVPPFAPGSSPWELQLCFKLDYDTSLNNVAQCLINSLTGDFRMPKISVRCAANATLQCQLCISTNGTGWTYNPGYPEWSGYDYSKKSYLNLTYDGSAYVLRRKQENGEFAVHATYTSPWPFYQDPNDTGFSLGADISSGGQWVSYFRGILYLNETFIRYNSIYWFRGDMKF